MNYADLLKEKLEKIHLPHLDIYKNESQNNINDEINEKSDNFDKKVENCFMNEWEEFKIKKSKNGDILKKYKSK